MWDYLMGNPNTVIITFDKEVVAAVIAKHDGNGEAICDINVREDVADRKEVHQYVNQNNLCNLAIKGLQHN